MPGMRVTISPTRATTANATSSNSTKTTSRVKPLLIMVTLMVMKMSVTKSATSADMSNACPNWVDMIRRSFKIGTTIPNEVVLKINAMMIGS